MDGISDCGLHRSRARAPFPIQSIGSEGRLCIVEHLLALDADPASIYVRVHTLDFSSMPPARHRAYAFQWFTFAFAAVVILLVVQRKRKPRKSDSTKVDDV